MNIKKTILLSVFVISVNILGVIAQDFITTWQTTANNESITIPTTGGGYSYTVDWGDGSGDATVYTGDATHIYATAGLYTVSISGNFPRILFVDASNRLKIRSIEQWGGQLWTSMNYAFQGCSNLVGNATDVPNLSSVNDMVGMFNQASSFNQDISDWDVSNVTTMNSMFCGATAFNQDISDWDVSNVTNMTNMFFEATSFNQDLSAWDVSNVTNMWYMFSSATSFNQDISTWDVGNVTAMYGMFFNASSFNQNLSAWDVSNVTDMGFMFADATAFNQDISSWNVSKVTNMVNMFKHATSFNQYLSSWDVGNVTDMSGMFYEAEAFNQDISTWDVSKVTNMSWMFCNARVFNQDLSSWDVSSVTSMAGMFSMAWVFNQDVSGWDVSNVTDMSWMFNNARAFNQDVSGWNVSNVTSMKELFRSTPFNQDLSSWDVSNVTDMGGMFVFAYAFNQDLSSWDVSSVTSMVEMFASAQVFNQDLSAWDVSNVNDMRWMFHNAQAFNQDLSGWNISNLTSMTSMFDHAQAFNQDLSGWDVSNVTNMRAMFNGATSFNQDISSWNVSNVTDMEYMLDWCNLSMTNYDLILEGWAVQNVQSGVTLGAQDLKYCNGCDARTLLINKGWSFIGDEGGCPQYITFDPPETKTIGDAPFELTASASSGLTVGFWSNDVSVATIEGNIVTIVGAGSVVISAYQSGGSCYEAADFLNQVLTVNKGDQTITFAPLDTKTIGDAPFALSASASSGLDVSFSSSNESVAMIDGNKITIVGAGSTTITASQAGNDNYNIASPVDQVLTVNKVDQTITFDPLATKTMGDAPFELTAAASSGLDISYSSSDENVATIEGNIVTIVGAGNANIFASQAGNEEYNAADSVDQVLTVNKADQTITFGPLDSKTMGDAPFELTAVASSGLDVSYSSSNENVATIDGNAVTIVGAGSTTITASQTGNKDYNAAASVDLVLTVNKADQTITFGPLDSKTMGDAPFELTATASSGRDISYTSSDETVATIEGDTLTIVGTGSATITASQAGDDNYNAAVPVDQLLTVNKADQTITFDPLATKTLGEPPFALTASSSSGLTVNYTSSDETIAIIDGSTVTILGVGTTIITATQEGNEDFNSAPPVEQSFEVIASTAVHSYAGANISIYPNPASNHITIQHDEIIDRVEILDMNGTLLSTQSREEQIDISHLKVGIYLLIVYTADNIYVGEIIKH